MIIVMHNYVPLTMNSCGIGDFMDIIIVLIRERRLINDTKTN